MSSQACPNSCSGNGRCSDAGRECKCFDGFTGADCSLKICPSDLAWSDQSVGTDLAHNSAECSNMGKCDRATGLCTCRTGFEGKACERKSCPTSCNGKGICQSMYYYATTQDPGAATVYSYSTIWDAYKIYGCNCDDGYYGIDCLLRQCPTGDDPMTGNAANTVKNPVQYNDVQKVVCKATSGTFTLSFRGQTTVKIPYNAKSADLLSYIDALTTVGSVKIVMYSTQACSDQGASWTVEFLDNFGNLPYFVSDAAGLTSGSSSAAVTISKITIGSKEDTECSGRGVCATSTGICECSTNYASSNGYAASGTRGDCGYASSTIQFCPGSVSCSGHGTCAGNPTYKCSCSTGWQGADCSDRTCPTGTAWFHMPSAAETAHLYDNTECSSMGTCDREAGTCTCDAGFSGSACQYLTCPGETDLCSAHGECLDMNTLAKRAKVNGVYPSTLHSYGNTPNTPSTWDAYKIQGCLCDSGYSGYDCSDRTCPSGDNPDTLQQVDEIQLIVCSDSDLSGSIAFSFKEEVSTSVAPSATMEQVKTAIESLSTIGTVTVELLSPSMSNALCTAKGTTQVLVTFNTEHGDLPLLVLKEVSITSTSVTEYVAGTKEEAECSNRGLCDRTTGLCTCFSGYGSSDGMGGAGSNGDCGFIEPTITSAVV